MNGPADISMCRSTSALPLPDSGHDSGSQPVRRLATTQSQIATERRCASEHPCAGRLARKSALMAAAVHVLRDVASASLCAVQHANGLLDCLQWGSSECRTLHAHTSKSHAAHVHITCTWRDHGALSTTTLREQACLARHVKF